MLPGRIMGTPRKPDCPKFTWKKLRQIRRLRISGLSLSQLEARFGISRQWVCNRLKSELWEDGLTARWVGGQDYLTIEIVCTHVPTEAVQPSHYGRLDGRRGLKDRRYSVSVPLGSPPRGGGPRHRVERTIANASRQPVAIFDDL